MVLLHENIVGIDSAIFMHPTIWKASGHVDAFNDPLIDNKDSKKRYRADVLIEDQLAKYEEKIEKEVAKAAMEVMKPYCVTVKRETLDEDEGEAVVGYYVTGEILMCVILDPFEVPVMKVALDKGTLKEYILAANELTEDMLASLDK